MIQGIQRQIIFFVAGILRLQIRRFDRNIFAVSRDVALSCNGDAIHLEITGIAYLFEENDTILFIKVFFAFRMTIFILRDQSYIFASYHTNDTISNIVSGVGCVRIDFRLREVNIGAREFDIPIGMNG